MIAACHQLAMTMPNVINLMYKIPGIDTKHRDFCKTNKTIAIRGYPNDIDLPQFINDPDDLSEPLARQFYSDFRDLYHHPAMLARHRYNVLQDKVKNNTISELASDPNFKV